MITTTLSLLTLVLSTAVAKPTPPRASVAPRAHVFIPEDADPCQLERFRDSALLTKWINDVSPNTATAARCYHTPPKLLPVVSDLMGELDAGKWGARGDARVDLRAAALLGYRLDSLIDVTKDGQRSLGVILKQSGNGPVAAIIYTAR